MDYISILLCTCNGGEYLREQLNSYEFQTESRWKLYASDDGSFDNTVEILNSFNKKWGEKKVNIRKGPMLGFAKNFLSLTCSNDINSKYYSYSDQDDIWLNDKLAKAILWIEGIPESVPAMYFSSAVLVDSENKNIGYSQLFSKSPSFANALVQNIASGNTIVFNNSAREILRKITYKNKIPAHDWLLYLVVTGVGGCVFYDAQPSIRYRQHANNKIGAKFSLRSNLKKIMNNQFKEFNDLNIELLNQVAPFFSEENKKTYNHFVIARKMALFKRSWNILLSGVHRQKILGNLLLIIAVIFGKI